MAKPEDAWKTFTYAPGVTVEMPGTPTDAGADVVVLKRGEGRGLSVQCMDSGTPAHAAQLLLGARSGIIGDRTLLSEKKVTRGNAKGMRLEIATASGATGLHVLLLAGPAHLCNFTSIVSDRAAADSETERFLASAKVD